VVLSVSSSAWRSEIFTDRCEATVSLSFAGSSICATDASVSAGTFLLSLMYCSKLALTVRISASVSLPRRRSRAIFSMRGLEEIRARNEARHAGARLAFDQHAHGLVGQLQKLQHRRHGADGMQAIGVGSSSAAFFWVRSRICFSSFMTSSSARTDFSRPTKRGTIIWGNTTMSRSGRTGANRPPASPFALFTTSDSDILFSWPGS
jgi:hypothetical protein